jgi:hypothetical protein
VKYTEMKIHTMDSIERDSPDFYSEEQCSAVQCSAVQCSAVQCSAVRCSVLDLHLALAAPGMRQHTPSKNSVGILGISNPFV